MSSKTPYLSLFSILYTTNSFLSILVVGLLAWDSVLAQSASGAGSVPWHLEKDQRGIQIYSRFPEDSDLKEVKAICDIEGTLSQLLAYTSDVENYTAVVYRTKTAYLVKQVSEKEFYYYNETSFPWPVKSRDMVVHLVIQTDPAKKQLTLQTTSVADMITEHRDVVRVPLWRGLWLVRQKDASRLQIEYTFKVDPGGKLPHWLVNLTAVTGPYSSFINLEKALKSPRYQNKKFACLAN